MAVSFPLYKRRSFSVIDWQSGKLVSGHHHRSVAAMPDPARSIRVDYVMHTLVTAHRFPGSREPAA